MDLIIIGAGGHARVIIDAVRKSQSHTIRGIVDTTRKAPSVFEDWEVTAELPSPSINSEFIVAVGDNAARAQLYAESLEKGLTPATIIHPSAIIAEKVSIGKGTILCAGSIIGPYTKIGENCIVNTAASVDHDCEVGDHSHLCPGARLPGSCRLGNGVFFGTAAAAIPQIKVGDWAVIGAGSVVIKDVDPRTKVVGISRVIPQ